MKIWIAVMALLAGACARADVAGNAEFAARLYGALAGSGGNLFVSPYSVATAMSMACAGARGQTAAEIATAAGLPAGPAAEAAAAKAVDAGVASDAGTDGVKLRIANALCRTGPVKLTPGYLDTLASDYAARFFSGGVGQINAWVKDRTEGKIDRLLDQLSANSACVLLNAIYFKAAWAMPFDQRQTREGLFTEGPGRTAKTNFMNQTESLRMLDGEGFQGAEIPYKGGHFAMVMLLPAAVDGLAGLEKKVVEGALGDWLAKLDQAPQQQVELGIPRFRMNTKYALVDAFKFLGVRAAFDPAVADFSGMDGRRDLFIGQIEHAAYVDVNEQGTEAAAATGVEMRALAILRTRSFRADHPFLFLIRRGKTILFIGRFAEPPAG